MTPPYLKIGDIARSKKNGVLLKVVGVTPFHIFMESTNKAVNPAYRNCRKRQFDKFYEKVG